MNCQCSPHAELTCDEARVARRDPSGTLDLRRAFIRALEKRWRRLARLATSALVDLDLFGLGSTSARTLSTIGMQGGRVPAFQQWLDTALADTLLGIDREQWIGNFVNAAYARGWARTARQVNRLDMHVLADRADILVKLAVTELQGIIEVVSQQAVRAFADGMLSHAPPRAVARLVRSRVNSIGVVRSRALAQFICVRAVADATLDLLTLAGHTHVGLVPETVPSPGRAGPIRDALFGRKRKRKKLKPPLAEIITAGDDDVCEVCQDLEDDNPYTIAQARGLIPAHPHCRCAWAPL
jgi:hypothetical protein